MLIGRARGSPPRDCLPSTSSLCLLLPPEVEELPLGDVLDDGEEICFDCARRRSVVLDFIEGVFSFVKYFEGILEIGHDVIEEKVVVLRESRESRREFLRSQQGCFAFTVISKRACSDFPESLLVAFALLHREEEGFPYL